MHIDTKMAKKTFRKQCNTNAKTERVFVKPFKKCAKTIYRRTIGTDKLFDNALTLFVFTPWRVKSFRNVKLLDE